MKKIIIFLLVSVLFATSCTSSSNKALSFEEFQEKYKRSEWSALLNNPATFYKDFENGRTLPLEDWTKDMSVFQKTEYSDTEKYTDVVLFNRPFEIHIWESQTYSFGGMIYYDSEDISETFSDFKDIFESTIKELGDPEVMRFNFDEVNEAEFRNCLKNLDDYDFFEARWKYDGGGMMLMFANYSSHCAIQIGMNE